MNEARLPFQMLELNSVINKRERDNSYCIIIDQSYINRHVSGFKK